MNELAQYSDEELVNELKRRCDALFISMAKNKTKKELPDQLRIYDRGGTYHAIGAGLTGLFKMLLDSTDEPEDSNDFDQRWVGEKK